MSGTRRAAFVAAMLCYLSGAVLLLTVYEAPMAPGDVQDTPDGELVHLRGDMAPFQDARLQDWQEDGYTAELLTSAPFTIVIKADAPLPKDGAWVVHGTLDARMTLDGQLHILIEADDVTAPLFAA